MKSRLMVQAYLVLTTTGSGAFYSGTTSLTLIFFACCFESVDSGFKFLDFISGNNVIVFILSNSFLIGSSLSSSVTACDLRSKGMNGGSSSGGSLFNNFDLISETLDDVSI